VARVCLNMLSALPVLVNGSAGALVTADGQPFAVMSFTNADDKIAGIDAIAPARVRKFTAGTWH
jgi:hypothetical protein